MTFALLARGFGGDLMLARTLILLPGNTVESGSHMFLDTVFLLAISILAFE